jgi:transposase
MRPRAFRLTEPEANQLQAAYRHAQDADTKIRYQAVRLYGTNYPVYPVAHILDICACSRTSLMEWVRAYRQRGLSALLDHRQGGNRARLQPQQLEALQNQLHRYTPAQLLGKDGCVGGDRQFWSVPDLAALLERDYGLTYQSPTSYRNLLAKCGFSYQRPAKQYKSHSDFKRMQFEELLEKNS